MATEEELKYIAEHPGGFDREFFEEHFPALIEQWREWASVGEKDYLVQLTTGNGDVLDVVYARAAQTWGVFFTEQMRAELLPYNRIVGITLRARPKKAEPRQIGFTAESI